MLRDTVKDEVQGFSLNESNTDLESGIDLQEVPIANEKYESRLTDRLKSGVEKHRRTSGAPKDRLSSKPKR